MLPYANIAAAYSRFQGHADGLDGLEADAVDRRFAAWLEGYCDKQADEAFAALVSKRGARYSACSFATFQADGNQAAVVDRLKRYAVDCQKHLKEGNGVVLFGPRGTGKDHLAVSLARECIRRFGVHVEWRNGMDIYAAFRDSFNDSSKESEKSIVDALLRPDVLYISDPLPPSGSLSEFQMGAMFRVLDGRYSHCKPTWVTINVRDGAEMDQRMGAQNGDRIRDGALALFCNWASHRKAIQ